MRTNPTGGYFFAVHLINYIKRLILGFMLPTWLLSMWISNTATTAMMMPIAMEVIEKLRETSNQKAGEEKTSTNITGVFGNPPM